jgi:hypothetical protein
VLRENGLSIALVTLFVIFLVGQSLAGILHYNREQLAHGEATVGFLEYLGSAHFLEAVAENWESEFLQISAYVIFTAILYRKGSAESKKLDQAEAVDRWWFSRSICGNAAPRSPSRWMRRTPRPGAGEPGPVVY